MCDVKERDVRDQQTISDGDDSIARERGGGRKSRIFVAVRSFKRDSLFFSLHC